VRQLIKLKDAGLFETFIKLLAGRVGQIMNHQSLASDVGVDGKTIKDWLSILEASFVVFKLQPYFENFGKRGSEMMGVEIKAAETWHASFKAGLKRFSGTLHPLHGQTVVYRGKPWRFEDGVQAMDYRSLDTLFGVGESQASSPAHAAP